MHPFVRDLYKRFLVVSRASQTPPGRAHSSADTDCICLTATRSSDMTALQVARDYPLPLDESKRRIREGFLRNSHLTAEEEVLRAVHHGRYKVSQPPHALGT